MSNETKTTAGSTNLATPLTDVAFEQAYTNHSPEFGEGWYGFTEEIKQKMQQMERQLADWKHNASRDVRNLTLQLENANKQLAEVRKDTERLDALDSRQNMKLWVRIEELYNGGMPIRPAIDKAMKEGE